MNTTLNEILKKDPCGRQSEGRNGFSKLLKYLGKIKADDEPLSFITILESNGILDATWCLRVLPDYDLNVMLFKLKCARRVQHLDKSGKAKATLDVVERFIDNNALISDLKNAAADAAAYAAAAGAHAAAAYAAAAGAHAAAAAGAHAAAAAGAAAVDAHAAAAVAAERKYQTELFKEIFGNGQI